MNVESLRDLAYLLAAVLFILDLKLLAHPRSAARGNWLGALGMAIAIVGTVVGQPMGWQHHGTQRVHDAGSGIGPDQ